MNESSKDALPADGTPTVAIASKGTKSAKPVVWHMYGSDINIRVVDGIPYVNGEKVEPASPFSGISRK